LFLLNPGPDCPDCPDITLMIKILPSETLLAIQ